MEDKNSIGYDTRRQFNVYNRPSIGSFGKAYYEKSNFMPLKKRLTKYNPWQDFVRQEEERKEKISLKCNNVVSMKGPTL